MTVLCSSEVQNTMQACRLVHAQHADLLADGGVVVALLRCATQYYSVKIGNDVELSIVVHVMLDPWGSYPDHLAPAAHTLHVDVIQG